MQKSDRETLYPLIINSSGLQSSTFNNTYRYTFPQGSVQFKNSKVAVSNINIYYSWYNITSTFNNNSFSFIFPNAGGTTTYTVNIPDGYYSISELNSYLQQYCITNNLYLINSSGDYVYYLEFITNSTYYSIQFNAYPVPTVLPAGWTDPGFSFPVASTTPRLVVPSTNFQNLIGFNAGTYPTPAQATTYSKLSDFTPQVSPTQSIILACSLLNNKYSNPSTILYSFTASNTNFGSIIESSPNQYSFVDIQDGSYPYFEISLFDQDYQPLQINDTNLVVQLLISSKD